MYFCAEKMKRSILKIKAIALAILVLVASNSYAITSHFCEGQLVAVSYFGDDVSCAMETTGDDCDSDTTMAKKCCSDTLTLIEGEDLNTAKELAFDYQQLHFVTIFLVSYIEIFQETVLLQKAIFKDLTPPDVEEDVQALYQTFLI